MRKTFDVRVTVAYDGRAVKHPLQQIEAILSSDYVSIDEPRKKYIPVIIAQEPIIPTDEVFGYDQSFIGEVADEMDENDADTPIDGEGNAIVFTGKEIQEVWEEFRTMDHYYVCQAMHDTIQDLLTAKRSAREQK